MACDIIFVLVQCFILFYHGQSNAKAVWGINGRSTDIEHFLVEKIGMEITALLGQDVEESRQWRGWAGKQEHRHCWRRLLRQSALYYIAMAIWIRESTLPLIESQARVISPKPSLLLFSLNCQLRKGRHSVRLPAYGRDQSTDDHLEKPVIS